mgnify:CR=1 FL=1
MVEEHSFKVVEPEAKYCCIPEKLNLKSAKTVKPYVASAKTVKPYVASACNGAYKHLMLTQNEKAKI